MIKTNKMRGKKTLFYLSLGTLVFNLIITWPTDLSAHFCNILLFQINKFDKIKLNVLYEHGPFQKKIPLLN